MTRRKLVIGNWKMNPASVDEAVTLARAVDALPRGGAAMGVAVPAVFLLPVAEALRASSLAVYAQDVHWEEKGAFTGQLAAVMLARLAPGTIVGHSEVRRDQGDDDARVARKAVRALEHGLWTVVCVGESEGEYVADRTAEVVGGQIGVVVRAIRAAGSALAARLVVAYEPIWAIGTGRAATAAHAAMASAAIRAAMAAEGVDGEAVPILYGGSVTAANAREFAAAAGIDGALVGGASLKAPEFGAIVAAFGA